MLLGFWGARDRCHREARRARVREQQEHHTQGRRPEAESEGQSEELEFERGHSWEGCKEGWNQQGDTHASASVGESRDSGS